MDVVSTAAVQPWKGEMVRGTMPSVYAMFDAPL